MKFSINEIEERLQLGEDSDWEFKQIIFKGDQPDSPKRDDLADEIAAFANAGGGNLICSVSDSGDIKKMSKVQLDNLVRLVEEICSDSIKPQLFVEVNRFRIVEKNLLLVSVPEGDSIHDSPGGSYIRSGSSKRKLNSEQRLRLARRRSQASYLWFDKQPIPDSGLNTLDKSLWKHILSSEGLKEPEIALNNLALLSPDHANVTRATVAGILLCTQHPENWLSSAHIKATCYSGIDRASSQLDSLKITGPVNQQIQEAIVFVKRNMRVAAIKDPGRIDLPQYSLKAIFEAIVNAVVHRDYSVAASAIRLSIFQDRLAINSPGSLPNDLTIDSMSTRQATRNEVLASVFSRMPVTNIPGSNHRQFLMEKRGDGVTIIRRETRELCGKYPVFELLDDAELQLTIPAANTIPKAETITITAQCVGQPVSNVKIFAIFPNKIWKQSETNSYGEAYLELYSIQLPMVVYAASKGYEAAIVRDWIPINAPLTIELVELVGGGGVVITPDGAREIPGLHGTIIPIQDTHDRSYMYASKISINQGMQQPVIFELNEELKLTDSFGSERLVKVVDIVGKSALVEYRQTS